MKPAPQSQQLALMVALALVVVWGANFTVQKLIFPILTPAGFLFVRFLTMPLLAALWMCYRYGVDWPPLDRSDWWPLIRLALAGHVLHVGLVTFGIHWSTAFSSSLILACGPIFTLLLLRITGLETMTVAQVAGVAIACAGVLLFMSEKLLGEGWAASTGDIVLLVSATFFSYYTVAAKPLIQRLGGVPVMAYTTFIAAPILVAASFNAGTAVDWAGLAWPVWVGTVYGVMISAFLGWILWGWVNAVRGVARTAPIMYLMPVVAGIVAWFFVAEPMTSVKLAGAAVTLVGVALAQYGGSWLSWASGRRGG